MGKVAWIFPGQGAQTVGMGKDVYEEYPEARQIFDTADKVLGYALKEICFTGDEAVLRKTANTQPALLTTSVALLQVLNIQPLPVDYVAGHSLGEYTALVAAGALSFEEAVHLVHVRGQLMEEAVPQGQGGMAAVLELDREILGAVCQSVTAEGEAVQMANLNSPGQIVISGTKLGVQRAGELAVAKGARRVMPLDVSGPFHSILMQPAAEQLLHHLKEANITRPSVPVVSNVSAQPLQHPEEIGAALHEQVTSSVLWEDSVRWMIQQGVDIFVEIGPGSVLSGLVKKVDRKVQVLNVQGTNSIEAAWQFFHQAK